MNQKQEFAERLRAAMTTAGYELRPVVLERQFNARYWGKSMTLQGVRRWLRGEAIPTQEKLQVLADWLNIEPHVLRFGSATSQKILDRKNRWDSDLDHLERETFAAFLALPAAQRKVLREVIFTFAKAHNE
ncbi:MAG TPA: transcriptional regulator [Casimicrobium sp.]|nr:transcriptional regulator [Casimicrobium sp.]